MPIVYEDAPQPTSGRIVYDDLPPVPGMAASMRGGAAEHSNLGTAAQMTTDFAQGAAGSLRGALNLSGAGEDNPFDFPDADPSSGMALIGSLSDPVAWAVGAGSNKVLPYSKVVGKGVVEGAKAIGKNLAGGAIPGAIIGGLTGQDKGSAIAGAEAGAVLNSVLPPVLGKIGKVAGKVATALDVKERAAAILRRVAGTDSGAIMAATAAAPADLTAAQAASGVNNDVFNALDSLARDRDIESYFSRLDARQKASVIGGLTKLAGGANQTEALQTTRASKNALNAVTGSMRDTELNAADTAGKQLPVLQAEANRLGAAASSKVEDVRRLEAARQTAEEVAGTGRMNLEGRQTPVLGQEGLETSTSLPYSRGQELVTIAERGSQKAADDSLALGAARRDVQARADSLKANGLTPLDTGSVIATLKERLDNPKLGVPDINRRVITVVARKIDEWTQKGGGVIDAQALYEIRKSAVNDTIDRLMGSATPKAKEARAAAILTQVKPLIDNAIEKAGGTGWRDYLSTYEQGAHVIDQQRMGAKALELYNKSPGTVESLSAGNEPKIVKKVFGTESDLDAAMGPKAQPIHRAASELARDRLIKEGGSRGLGGLESILKEHGAKFRLPNWINAKIAVTNRVLSEVEGHVNKNTMKALYQGMRSGADANELLSIVPVAERSRVIRAMINSEKSPKTRAFMSGFIAAQEREDAQQ